MKLCPLIKEECCESKCMFWVTYVSEKGESTNTCCIVLQTMLVQQGVVESIRVQKSVQSLRNEMIASISSLGQTIGGGLSYVGDKMLQLKGVSDKDEVGKVL